MRQMKKYIKPLLYLSFFTTGYALFSASVSIPSQNIVLAAQDTNNAADIVFVIDNSGSMKKNDPKFMTPQVVSAFVRQLPKNTQVGIVLFDQKSRLLVPLTRISNSESQQRVIDHLQKIDYRGQFTNTPIGIERSLYELKSNGRKGAQKNIIFITDGIVDTGNKARDQELTRWLKKDIAGQCKLMGVRIFGIALTEAADFSLIQSLAANTDGEYFRTFSVDAISGVLDQIKILLTSSKANPDQELAPLELLPMPKKVPLTKPAEQTQTETTQLANKPKEKTVAGKGFWMITITLILISLALIGALFFFFLQNTRKKEGVLAISEPTVDKDTTIPDAYLEDIEQILNMEKLPFKMEKELVNIGRSPRNDLVIDELAVSGFHARIEFRHMNFYLEDLLSTNGTLLNDRRLKGNEPVRIKNGDCISFANFKFNFTITNQIPFGDTIMVSMTTLEDPDAAATIVLDLEDLDSHNNNQQGLLSCIQNHLTQIYGLSAKHKDYVDTYFPAEILDMISTEAHKNMQKTVKNNQQHCTPIIKNKAFYVICSLPAAIDNAAEWYGSQFNGFTQFIFKWIRSKRYESAQCDQLCVVTVGQNPSIWVSITIVPTHSEPEPIEIMSVDFLNEEEKSSLGLDFDNHGRVI